MSTRPGVVSKAEADERHRRAFVVEATRVRGELESGTRTPPRCCGRCRSREVAAIGMWGPSLSVLIATWGPRARDSRPPLAIYGMCGACSADPETPGIIEALIARDMRREGEEFRAMRPAARRALEYQSN